MITIVRSDIKKKIKNKKKKNSIKTIKIIYINNIRDYFTIIKIFFFFFWGKHILNFFI